MMTHTQFEVEEVRRKQEEATAALLAATTTPQHHHVAEQEGTEENDDIPNGDISKDLYTGEEPIEDPIEERRTLAERNERLQNQLKVGWLIWISSLVSFTVTDDNFYNISPNMPNRLNVTIIIINYVWCQMRREIVLLHCLEESLTLHFGHTVLEHNLSIVSPTGSKA